MLLEALEGLQDWIETIKEAARDDEELIDFLVPEVTELLQELREEYYRQYDPDNEEWDQLLTKVAALEAAINEL